MTAICETIGVARSNVINRVSGRSVKRMGRPPLPEADLLQQIEAAGADLRYLPPYSPDFNPIENAFAKLKSLLRKAAERTIGGLWDAIGRIIDLFPPAECANCLSAAGYDATCSYSALMSTIFSTNYKSLVQLLQRECVFSLFVHQVHQPMYILLQQKILNYHQVVDVVRRSQCCPVTCLHFFCRYRKLVHKVLIFLHQKHTHALYLELH
jgi:hypothetical protein